jgi:hypothetical protein
MTDTNYDLKLKKTMKESVRDYLASQLGEEAVTDAKLEAMFNEKGRHTAYNGEVARAWAEGKGGPKTYRPSAQVNRLRVLASLAPMGELRVDRHLISLNDFQVKQQLRHLLSGLGALIA